MANILANGEKDDLLLLSEERLHKTTSKELIILSCPFLTFKLQLVDANIKAYLIILLSDLESLNAEIPF